MHPHLVDIVVYHVVIQALKNTRHSSHDILGGYMHYFDMLLPYIILCSDNSLYTRMTNSAR
jgi:hypothetical protein